VQLVHHCVDGIFQLEDFAFDVDGDFSRKIAVCHGGGHVGDVADLAGQIAAHESDVVSEVFPHARDVFDQRLAAELAFGADLASDTGDFRGERAELIDHGIDGVFQLEDFSSYVDRDFLGKVAVSYGGGHFGDVADLAGEV